MRVFPDIHSLPFGKSPLTFFVGQVTGKLLGGNFVFDGTQTRFLAPHPLVPQSVYFFWDFNFSIDAVESDYTGAIISVPLLSVYTQANPTAPIFRQPFPVPVYYENKTLYQGIWNHSSPNELLFSITGLINQSPELLGKSSLVATVQFTAFEITERDYVARFMEGLDVAPPLPPKGAFSTDNSTGEKLAKLNAENPGIQLEGGMRLPA